MGHARSLCPASLCLSGVSGVDRCLGDFHLWLRHVGCGHGLPGDSSGRRSAGAVPGSGGRQRRAGGVRPGRRHCRGPLPATHPHHRGGRRQPCRHRGDQRPCHDRAAATLACCAWRVRAWRGRSVLLPCVFGHPAADPASRGPPRRQRHGRVHAASATAGRRSSRRGAGGGSPLALACRHGRGCLPSGGIRGP
ncbi:hypothetical protein PSET11_00398 [Arthrobacter ulcerisalmonis]|uniref:Uncharacterized protein n=1 Tax=Arthrobacter ulcerisalmonis TaxID=2483813 RepID=A0A3P5W5L2_9MICC|nr:hypothetical protein PSET11_00398 [Arthrobacter ulcerisalmonis]